MNSYSTSWWSLLLIYRPREDERLSWICWLTYSGRFTHINGYPSAAGPVQTSESSPIRDRRSTTEPPNQLFILFGQVGTFYNLNDTMPPSLPWHLLCLFPSPCIVIKCLSQSASSSYSKSTHRFCLFFLITKLISSTHRNLIHENKSQINIPCLVCLCLWGAACISRQHTAQTYIHRISVLTAGSDKTWNINLLTF